MSGTRKARRPIFVKALGFYELMQKFLWRLKTQVKKIMVGFILVLTITLTMFVLLFTLET